MIMALALSISHPTPTTLRPPQTWHSVKRPLCGKPKMCRLPIRATVGKGKLDKWEEGDETESGGAFFNALQRLQEAAGEDEAESFVFNEETAMVEGSQDERASQAESSIEDEDAFVSQLLEAAGLNDNGLPLYTLPGDKNNVDEGEVAESTRHNSAERGKRRESRDQSSTAESYIPDELLPRVAIVGRPNVGKSALFNRIIGRQVAIVYDYPGVTRDRLYTRASWGMRDFMLIDTGGLTSDAAGLGQRKTFDAAEESSGKAKRDSSVNLPAAIERQAVTAIDEADVIVLVVDGQVGTTAADEEVLSWLRRNYPDTVTLLAVNKCENVAKADQQTADFWASGLEPIAVSAISGSGTGDLLDAVVKELPPSFLDASEMDDMDEIDEDGTIRLAIVGRPNVGKSSLLNSLVGEERFIVSDIAGTTRDAVDTTLPDPKGRGVTFMLVDTAGVRRRAAVASTKDGAEPLSVDRSFRAIKRSDVAVLVLDATEGITQQDFRLAEYVAAEGRACVVVVNKWDAIPAKTETTLSDYEANVRSQLRPIEWANIVFTSAKTGQRVQRVLDAAFEAAKEHRRRITTATLNLVLQDATTWRTPPTTGMGRRGRIYYGTQAGTKPPTFVLFCNYARLFGPEYKRYMERQFRENIGYPGTPLRLYWRGKS